MSQEPEPEPKALLGELQFSLCLGPSDMTASSELTNREHYVFVLSTSCIQHVLSRISRSAKLAARKPWLPVRRLSRNGFIPHGKAFDIQSLGFLSCTLGCHNTCLGRQWDLGKHGIWSCSF